MKRLLKCSLLLVGFLFLLILSSCGDQKSPEKGYITSEKLDEIVKTFEDVDYNKYSYEGSLNYFDYEDSLIPRTISKKNVNFEDSKEKFSAKCSSYYLNVPLHITPVNWESLEVDSSKLSLSTKYQLTSKIYRPAGLDKVYFYEREGGGFILKAFAVNKSLRIVRPSDITCHAKWNIEIEYDENGYLISEKFGTVNASEKNKKDSCYGQATYVFKNI